jgi:hypothetical protein
MLSEFVSKRDISRPIVVTHPSQGSREMGNGTTIRENIKEDTHNHPIGPKHSMSFIDKPIALHHPGIFDAKR